MCSISLLNPLFYSETLQRESSRVSSRKQEEEDLELPFLDLDTVSEATSGFSAGNKLGQGGFGPVYKVTKKNFLSNSQIVCKKGKMFCSLSREHWLVDKKLL